MSGKRTADSQVTRENLHEFENEDDETPLQPNRASADVLSKRKILKPRGRLAGRAGSGASSSSTTTGASSASSGFNFKFGQSTASTNGSNDKPSNPFAGFGTSGTSNTISNDKPAFSFGTTTSPSFKAPEVQSSESKPQAIFSFINNEDKTANSTSLVSTKDIDKPSKIKALNDTFYDKITQERNTNPVSNFTPILRKYIDYYDRIENDLEIPDADQEDEHKETKALPAPEAKPTFNFGSISNPTFTLQSTTSISSSAPAPASAPASAFSFGQQKTQESKIEGGKKEESEVIDVDSEESDDSIKIEGPTFNVDKPISTSDGVFKLSKDAPKVSAPSSTGPTFSFTSTASKNYDSPFKLKPVAQKENVNEESKTEKKNLNLKGSSSNNFTWSPGKPINLTPGEEKPAASFTFGQKVEQKKIEEEKPVIPAFSFGNTSTQNDSLVSKPTFSFGSTTSTTDQKKTAFNFGASTTTSTDTSKPVFSFGTTPSTDTTDKPKFSFGQNSNTNTTAFGSNSTGSTFGSGSQFSFNFSRPTNGDSSATATATTTATNSLSTSATESKNDDDDEKVEEIEVKGDFKVAELTEKIEEKTGEEDEELLYTKRSKIQLFNTETKTYDSKGLGDLKVLKHKETKKSRILVRADGSNRVILNVAVVKDFKYETIGKGNLVRIPAAVDNKIETYLAQVKTPEDGKNLLTALKDAQSALE